MAIGREAREQWPWLEKSEIRRSSNSTTLGVHRADKQGLIKYNLRIIHYHIKSHLSSREKIYDREGVNKKENGATTTTTTTSAIASSHIILHFHCGNWLILSIR